MNQYLQKTNRLWLKINRNLIVLLWYLCFFLHVWWKKIFFVVLSHYRSALDIFVLLTRWKNINLIYWRQINRDGVYNKIIVLFRTDYWLILNVVVGHLFFCFHNSYMMIINKNIIIIIIMYSLFLLLFDLTTEYINAYVGVFVTGLSVHAIANAHIDRHSFMYV